MAKQKDPETLWREIERAGSVDAFVKLELERLGYTQQAPPSDEMSKREYAEYKKSLKAEAAEKEANQQRGLAGISQPTHRALGRWDLLERLY